MMPVVIYTADTHKPKPVSSSTQPAGSTVYAYDSASGKCKGTNK